MAKNKKIFFNTLAAVLIFSVGIIAFFLLNKHINTLAAETNSIKQTEPKPILVETALSKTLNITDNISTVGTLLSNESVVITSEITGKVTGIFFNESEQVSAGQVLVKLDDSSLKASIDSAEADRALKKINHDRAAALIEQDAISRQEKDEAYASWQKAEAEVRRLKSEINKTVIKAPFSGTAGLRKISLGTYIQPGTEIVNLEDTSKLKVDFKIPQIDSGKIRQNQKIDIKIDSFPNRIFEGTVYAISPKIDEASRSLTVKGIMDNKDHLLRPGQFVNITIPVGDESQVLFIPEEAISSSAAGKSVFLVVGDKAVQTSIETGRRIKGYAEVTSGLSVGDIIIVKGQDKVKNGSSVTISAQ